MCNPTHLTTSPHTAAFPGAACAQPPQYCAAQAACAQPCLFCDRLQRKLCRCTHRLSTLSRIVKSNIYWMLSQSPKMGKSLKIFQFHKNVKEPQIAMIEILKLLNCGLYVIYSFFYSIRRQTDCLSQTCIVGLNKCAKSKYTRTRAKKSQRRHKIYLVPFCLPHWTLDIV